MESSTRQGGLTLIELIIYIVVVGVGVAGILLAYHTTVKSSADPLVRKQAVAIAEAILEEVASKEYTDPDGADGETSRLRMDDVDDYHGLTIPGDQTLGSSSLPALSGYTATVTVTAATLQGAPARQITVTVTGHGETVTLSTYRTDT